MEVLTIAQLKERRKQILNNVTRTRKVSGLNKVAIKITEKVGSVGFFLVIVIWTISWLSWNVLAPASLRFDPYPAFVLWLFMSNLLQIFLMPLIMIGQNLQADHADIRANADFEINAQAELEVETILIHLENQNDAIMKILESIEGQNKPTPIKEVSIAESFKIKPAEEKFYKLPSTKKVVKISTKTNSHKVKPVKSAVKKKKSG